MAMHGLNGHVIIMLALAIFMYSLSTTAKIIKDCWLQRAKHKLRQEMRDAHTATIRARSIKDRGNSTVGRSGDLWVSDSGTSSVSLQSTSGESEEMRNSP